MELEIRMQSENKTVTFNDAKRESICIDSMDVRVDNDGQYIRLNVSPSRKRFLFVREKRIDLDKASVHDIKQMLELTCGRQFVTHVFLTNDPNKHGTSCMISRSAIYALLDGVALPADAGRGAKIVEECLND